MIAVSVICFHLPETGTGVLEGDEGLLGVVLLQHFVDGHDGSMD